jgi:hypothetical protein
MVRDVNWRQCFRTGDEWRYNVGGRKSFAAAAVRKEMPDDVRCMWTGSAGGVSILPALRQ